MWKTKEFKTREKMNTWIEKNAHKFQWVEVFINNSFGVDYRRLRRIY